MRRGDPHGILLTDASSALLKNNMSC